MTPEEIRATRAAFGLSAERFARLVGAADGRTVRRWEAGDNNVPKPVTVILRAIIANPAVAAHFGVTIKSAE